MNYTDYFETVKGHGVLATADAEGKVDVALYARPHVLNEETLAFIMHDRLTHANLQSNPHAAYLFWEDSAKGYKGVRLHLKKISEEQNTERLYELRRKDYKDPSKESDPLFLVLFSVEKVLPLVGAGKQGDA